MTRRLLQTLSTILALASVVSCERLVGRHLQPATTTQIASTLRVSTDNPRYFADSTGRVVFLTGSHTWADLQDSGTLDPPQPFDYGAFLDTLVSKGHNFFRLWVWEQATGSADTPRPYFFSPTPYKRSGPGVALDGKPRFDLSRFDEEYFRRLRIRVDEARRRGIYVSVMLFDGWSIDDKGFGRANPWIGHPFNGANNINGVNGDADGDGRGTETHTLLLPPVTKLQEAYVRKVIETVNDLDNVLFEVSNESGTSSTAWQYHMIRYVKEVEAGKTKRHPVGMTAQFPHGHNGVLLASPADWISPNAVGTGVTNPPIADGRKVIIDDTDHLCGICGDADWAWRSFARGRNPIYMDVYDGQFLLPNMINPRDPEVEALRRNLGYIRAYANRVDLRQFVPRPDLASTSFCLAHVDSSSGGYFAYLPDGGSVTIDLTGSPSKLAVEWISPRLERTIVTDSIAGGQKVRLRSPFPIGASAVYLHS